MLAVVIKLYLGVMYTVKRDQAEINAAPSFAIEDVLVSIND